MEHISAEDTRARLAEAGDDLTLLDCREAMELEIASIAGATHIPMSQLVERIAETMRGAGEPYEIVVVDDDSRDGISGVVESLARAGHPVRILVRTDERGLATAVLAGFRESSGEILAHGIWTRAASIRS